MDVEKSRASVSAGEMRAREVEGHAESAGPQLGVGLAASANLVPVLPRQQQVFPSHELCSHCLCPSSSPDTTTGPLIFFQRAGSMPRTSCHL